MSARPDRLQGLLAEFHSTDGLLHAIEAVQGAGYRKYDVYSPHPVEEFSEAMQIHGSPLPWIVFAGGLMGAVGGWALQFLTSMYSFPMNIGGKPYNSWPSFIVVIFEMTILSAAFSTVLGLFALSGLPRPHHPVFNVDSFALASRNRYFLYVEAKDPRFELTATRSLLESLDASEVSAVED